MGCVSVAEANIHFSIGFGIINFEFLVGFLAVPARGLFAKTCCNGITALLSPRILVAAAAELKDRFERHIVWVWWGLI
jgi:hypothetical protein